MKKELHLLQMGVFGNQFFDHPVGETGAAKKNPKMDILLTTGYQTDLSRFDLADLKCHLLHKPYHNLEDVCGLLKRLLSGENVFEDADEDSFSENEDNPEITEWTL